MKISTEVMQSIAKDLVALKQSNADKAKALGWSFKKFLWACYWNTQDQQGLIIGDGIGLHGSHLNDASVNDTHILTMLKAAAKYKGIAAW